MTFVYADLVFPDTAGTMQQLLTAAEASGDIRKVIRAINMSFGYKVTQLPDADKPVRMSLSLANPTTTGLPTGSTNLLRRNFSGFFDESVDPTSIDVADEPA
ncbi:hypothetical protein [Coleofasciculus sp. G3-WIS-01]|uniref:hypothetical protein n=1 Tax=Coleofasciculus sp. G3-WIS-01 TaxID=3069528 RepID=UPI004062D045